MREIDDAASRCPFCGFSLHDPHPKIALPLKTVLNDRYVIGKPVKIDGEGISYIAYDAEKNQPAMIREYLPQQMVRRLPDGDLEMLQEYLPQYKALLSDFEELYSHIMSWKSMQHIRKVYDLFTANHTIYAVSVFEKGMTLNQFLERRGGKLSWNESRKLFDPLLAELEMVHNSGYLHRGISPDSLLVTEDGLVLIAFSICSAKVAGSEIEPSISVGYAAPEQYSVSQHGEWTDVYGICAVLYRVLTGVQPPSAQKRFPEQELIPPMEQNPSVPKVVSDAIMHGLSFHSGERIRSIHQLREELSGNLSALGTTQIHEVANETHPYYKSKQFSRALDDEDEEPEEDDLPRELRARERPVWQKILLRSIPIIIIICLILYQLMIGFPFLSSKHRHSDEEAEESLLSSETVSEEETASSKAEEEETEEEGTAGGEKQTVELPNFVGTSFDLLNTDNYPNLSFAQPAYVYSTDYDAGVICDQSLSAGTQVSPGTKISLTISLGSPYVTIPSAKTYTSEQYANLLKNKYGLPYTIQEAYHDEIAAGYIISVDPAPGTTFDLSGDDTIVIVESMGPDPSASP